MKHYRVLFPVIRDTSLHATEVITAIFIHIFVMNATFVFDRITQDIDISIERY